MLPNAAALFLTQLSKAKRIDIEDINQAYKKFTRDEFDSLIKAWSKIKHCAFLTVQIFIYRWREMRD